MGKFGKRALVKGRVQGVWYRGSTQKKAKELGVTGWAKNLADGRVEVLMCGEAAALAELESWLHEGPPMARVESVAVTDEPWQAFDSFTTG
ncbi:acylphosphatase [Endozoicomonas montiporae]|uniref:acylphosphatase n=2 Tax=Endozoicomonas montiporae TaxID=1027273 RepID=A0A081N9U7_9GAMM|nr:acylphosphatase [Endozoicomonas montiporae]AMO57117.1 acylphosphatase [Endozoicomonas montiporae CL-33]KEQ15220.1 acylphosphatase [Endozoicomonas montiporae]